MQYLIKRGYFFFPLALYLLVFMNIHFVRCDKKDISCHKKICIVGKRGKMLVEKENIVFKATKESSVLSIDGNTEVTNSTFDYAVKSEDIYSGHCEKIAYNNEWPFWSFKDITFINNSNDTKVSIKRCTGFPKHIFFL